MTCLLGCIAATPGHPGACLDANGNAIETAATTGDPDATHAISREAAPPVIWGLPFACPDCKAWGYVPVCVEYTRRTTDEQLMYFVDKKHRALAPYCLRSPQNVLLGRARRRKPPTASNPEGELIFLLKAGEDEHTVIDVRWPLFDQA